MEFRILGPLEVVRAAGPVALPGGRGRRLLALLVLHTGQVVPTERLIDELWGGEPPATAITVLHGLVSGLRRRLEPSRGPGDDAALLQTRPPGYLLAVDPGQVDANRFRRLLDEAADAEPPRRAALLRQALNLWRGPALADFTYEPFAQAEIAVLEELRLTAIEDRVDAELALGRHRELVGELGGLVAGHPYRERMRGQLMVALYRDGRQAEALHVYQEGRRTLVEELGIEPGPALAALETAILRQDPSLDSHPAPDPDGAVTAWLPPGRRTVSVVFTELAESGVAGDAADPEVVRRLVTGCFESARRIIEHHGGAVQGLIGGVVVAVFGVPTAHEDDALRAARAVVELQRAAADAVGPDLGFRLAARIGVNTGEVVLGDPATGLSGDAVTMAARLQQAAAEGEVLIGETTRRLLGNAAKLAPVPAAVLDRRGRPADAWRLVGLVPDRPTRPVADEEPPVGRAAELGRLRAAFKNVVQTGRAHRVTVIGEPGVGKSRLATEFAAALHSRARVLTGRCPAYGDGITFWPLREVVLQVAADRDGIAALLAGDGAAESTATQVASAIGLTDEPGAGRELFPAIRRLFEALARQRPQVVIVDDVHWAEPTFLDLLDYLTETVQTPVLIICLARPELLEQRAMATPFVLEALNQEDSEQLVHNRLRGRVVPDGLVAQIIAAGQGNPLFLEQLLAATRDEDELLIPPSLQALLAARLDRLGPAERDLLRCAAVIGTEFSIAALHTLVPAPARPFVERHLRSLETKELVRRSNSGFAFRHVLIQLTAYRGITREVRSELHERFGQCLEQTGGADEFIAYHFEQAWLQRRAAGLVDQAAADLAVRAGERLARAGLRALGRYDMAAAGNLLSRARPLLPAHHPARVPALRRLVAVCPALGRLDEADAVLAELLEHARSEADERLEQHIRLERMRVGMVAGPDPIPLDAVRAEAERSLAVFRGWDDPVGMSEACYVLAAVHLRAGRMRDLEDAARRGIAHARQSGDAREQLGAPWWMSFALLVGPTPVPQAIRECREVLWVGDTEHPGVLADLARLHAMLGEFGQARELTDRARWVVVERLRVRRSRAVVAHRTAHVEILAGDLAAAESELRTALAIATDMGEREQVSQVAADLARVLAARGADAEAAARAALSREQAPAESVTAQALWRAATARTADRDTAQRLLREAVGLVPPDMLNLRADLYVELAGLLATGAAPDLARAATREAVDCYERKGNVIGARRAHTRRAQIRCGEDHDNPP
jgi:DNA-binding SARP family transcriptional activator/tetratricopeptide (TPR) repeat protein